MPIKLFDSELKVMNVLWRGGDRTAKEISDILKAETGQRYCGCAVGAYRLEQEYHLHRH